MRLQSLLCTLLFVSCDSQSEFDPSQASGEQLFQRALCGSCHGSQGKGGWMGPSLADLGQNWTPGALAEFIKDPTERAENDERLSKLARKFPTRMAPNRTLSALERQKIAEWLLAR